VSDRYGSELNAAGVQELVVVGPHFHVVYAVLVVEAWLDATRGVLVNGQLVHVKVLLNEVTVAVDDLFQDAAGHEQVLLVVIGHG